MSSLWHSDPKIDAAIEHVATTHPYYLAPMTRLRIVEEPGLGTMATSAHWVTHYDPATVAGWTVAETSAVLVHELEHLLRRHHERCADRDPGRFNIAGDAEINQRLDGLPSGAVYPESIGMPRGRTAEVYYAAMAEQQPEQQPDSGDGSGDGDGSGSPSGSSGAGKPSQGKCGSAAGGPVQQHEQGDAANPGRGARDGGKAARREAAEGIIGGNGMYGTDPGDERREWAEQELGIDRARWYRALSAAVGHVMAPHGAPVRYQWPGRRDPRDMGGAMVPHWTGTRPSAAIVIDTSGSITPFDLEMAVAAAHYIGRFADVVIYSCNIVASRLGAKVPPTLRGGGGGTDMGAGITMAVEQGAKAVVVITDCETPWPAEQPVPVIVGANPSSRSAWRDRIPRWMTVLPVVAGDGGWL